MELTIPCELLQSQETQFQRQSARCETGHRTPNLALQGQTQVDPHQGWGHSMTGAL